MQRNKRHLVAGNNWEKDFRTYIIGPEDGFYLTRSQERRFRRLIRGQFGNGRDARKYLLIRHWNPDSARLVSPFSLPRDYLHAIGGPGNDPDALVLVPPHQFHQLERRRAELARPYAPATAEAPAAGDTADSSNK